ncbi:transposase [Trichonephila clavipes]|nr:transposase [Trichonephila clavipes]
MDDRSYQNSSRRGGPLHVGEDDIDQAIRSNSYSTPQELVETFNIEWIVCCPSDSPAWIWKAVSMRWDVHGIIHWNVLPLNQIINAALNCLQLDRLHANLAAKWAGLINCRSIIFHRDNARPHAVVITHQKLLGFGWEVLPHPPYSSDLAP